MKEEEEVEIAEAEEKEQEFICLSQAVKLYNIPKSLLEKRLPAPKLVDNPHYKCAAPMRLYRIADIESLLCEEDVQKAIAAREKRQETSKKAVETKLKKMEEKITCATKKISVKKVDDVEKCAVASYNSFHRQKAYEREQWDFEEADVKTASEDFLQRISVNFIRHHLTTYDNALWNVSGETGCRKFYLDYKCAVLDAIGKVYPKLKKECNRQKEQFKQDMIELEALREALSTKKRY